MRVLHPAPGVVAFYDGRVEGYRFAPEPNWVDEGALSLGIASYAVIDGDEALVYDTHVSIPHAAFIRDWLADQGVTRITVVLSHHHRDHVAGTAAFGPVPVIANVRTEAHLLRERDRHRDRNPPARDPPPRAAHRDFRRCDASLTVGTRRVELFTANIHSDDQTLLWLPDAGLLLAGDALEDTVTYVSDPADLGLHLSDLDRLEGMFPSRILPNHGDPDRIAEGGYDPALIGATRRYVEFLLRSRNEPALAALPLETGDCR